MKTMGLPIDEYREWDTNMVHKSITDLRQITEQGQTYVYPYEGHDHVWKKDEFEVFGQSTDMRVKYPVFICKREPHQTWGWVDKDDEEYKIVFK
jgi:hypothetical protein